MYQDQAHLRRIIRKFYFLKLRKRLKKFISSARSTRQMKVVIFLEKHIWGTLVGQIDQKSTVTRLKETFRNWEA